MGSPLGTQASGAVTMTCDLSVETPLSTLAGGAVRMRRMAFLSKSEPFIVLIPPPTENSRSLGGHHRKPDYCFLPARINKISGQVKFILLIGTINIIY